MPRKPRFNLVGIPQHVIQRGNNREPCFYSEQKSMGSDSIDISIKGEGGIKF